MICAGSDKCGYARNESEFPKGQVRQVSKDDTN
jgi:hypothetical protein